jgi:predicted RNase H-like HicB family nuclease
MAFKKAELLFEVIQEQDGGFVADCLNEDIITQGDSWDELRKNVIEAVNAFLYDSVAPSRVGLHLVRDEILSLA